MCEELHSVDDVQTAGCLDDPRGVGAGVDQQRLQVLWQGETGRRDAQLHGAEAPQRRTQRASAQHGVDARDLPQPRSSGFLRPHTRPRYHPRAQQQIPARPVARRQTQLPQRLLVRRRRLRPPPHLSHAQPPGQLLVLHLQQCRQSLEKNYAKRM